MLKSNKEKAFDLRRRNKSYNEISEILKIPKSTLSNWLSADKNSQKIKALLSDKSSSRVAKRIKDFTERNKLKWKLWREEARIEARKEFSSLKKDPLFIAGMMLYWGEGDKQPQHPVRLTNTSPEMIALYVKFLIKTIKVPAEKIRGAIIRYPDLPEKHCLDFWSKASGLSKSQFVKTQVIHGRHPSKRINNGICMIVCNSRQLKEKFIVWIDLLGKTL